MPIPVLIAAAIPLVTEFVPYLIGKLFGDKGEKVAKDVIDIAKTITGQDDPTLAANVLRADPNLIVQFQTRMAEIDLEYRKLDAEDYKTYHETLQTDAKSEDEYVRRWRPLFGYRLSQTWTLMFYLVFFAILMGILGDMGIFVTLGLTSKISVTVVCKGLETLFNAIWPMWTMALAILGVNILERSKDKAIVAGIPQQGVLDKVLSVIKR